MIPPHPDHANTPAAAAAATPNNYCMPTPFMPYPGMDGMGYGYPSGMFLPLPNMIPMGRNALFSSTPTKTWFDNEGALTLSLAVDSHIRDSVKHMPLSTHWICNVQVGTDVSSKGDYNDQMLPTNDTISTLPELLAFLGRLGHPSTWIMYSMLIARSNDKVPVDGVSIFKKGIRPAWEDAMNANGGHFEIKLETTKDCDASVLDHVWTVIALAIIGNPKEVDPNNVINGIRTMKKKNNKTQSSSFYFLRLEIWLKTSNMDARNNVIKALDEQLHISFSNLGNGKCSFSLRNAEFKSHDTSRYNY